MLRTLAGALAGVAAAGQAATAQTYPSQPIRLVVPFAAGAVNDVLGRMAAEHLRQRTGQTVVVENRIGASGNLGLSQVAQSTPDGYTIAMAGVTNFAVNPLIFKTMPLDMTKDLVAVAPLAETPLVVTTNARALPMATFQEFVAYARANPGKLNYASAGLHSASFIAAELLNVVGGIKMVHVPYKGIPDAHTSIMRGDAAVFMTFYSAAADLIASGKLRAIGIAASKRTPVLPDVPAVKEVLPAYEYDAWFGYFAPAGVPRPVIDKVSRDIGEVARQESYRGRFAKLGVDISPSTPEEFERLVKSDSERFIKIFGRADDKAPDKK